MRLRFPEGYLPGQTAPRGSNVTIPATPVVALVDSGSHKDIGPTAISLFKNFLGTHQVRVLEMFLCFHEFLECVVTESASILPSGLASVAVAVTAYQYFRAGIRPGFHNRFSSGEEHFCEAGGIGSPGLH